jgi:hypothetical protein
MIETKQTTLTVYLDSEVSTGRIKLRDLVLLGKELQSAFETVARLITQPKVSERGALPEFLKVATTFELSAIEEGSFSLVLNLPQSEYRRLGEQALEILFKGLEDLYDRSSPLPTQYNKRILKAWYKIGRLFDDGINLITFDLAIGQRKTQVVYGLKLYSIISEKISALDQLNYTFADEIDEKLWLFAASHNSVFDDLNDLEEDIYSLSDGKPFYD